MCTYTLALDQKEAEAQTARGKIKCEGKVIVARVWKPAASSAKTSSSVSAPTTATTTPTTTSTTATAKTDTTRSSAIPAPNPAPTPLSARALFVNGGQSPVVLCGVISSPQPSQPSQSPTTTTTTTTTTAPSLPPSQPIHNLPSPQQPLVPTPQVLHSKTDPLSQKPLEPRAPPPTPTPFEVNPTHRATLPN